MATATMTFTDTEDGEIEVGISFDIPLSGPEDATKAIALAMDVYADCVDVNQVEVVTGEDETKLVGLS